MKEEKNRVNLTQFELAQDICFDPTPFIAAGVSAASTVGSAAINAGSKWGSSTYLRVAKEMAQYNQAMNEAMYNKYQSPAALMAQYKEAGLNPYLVYGNAQPSGPEAGQVSTNPSDYESDKESVGAAALGAVSGAISQYQQIVSQEQALTNAKKQADLLAAQTVYTLGKAANQEWKNQHQQEMYDLDKQLKSTTIEQKQLDLLLDRKYKEQRLIADIDNKLQDLHNKKTKDRETEANILLLEEKRKEVAKNIEYLDTRVEYTRFSMDLQNRKYDLDLQRFAEIVKRNEQNYNLAKKRYAHDIYKTGLKVYQQGVAEKQFDDKMQAAREVAGLGVLKYISDMYNKYGGSSKGSPFEGINFNVPSYRTSGPWKGLPAGRSIPLIQM